MEYTTWLTYGSKPWNSSPPTRATPSCADLRTISKSNTPKTTNCRKPPTPRSDTGGANNFFKEARAYDQPLYNFFKIYDLADLKLAQMQELLRRRARVDRIADF